HYVKEIQTLQPQGPYFLGGLSFGGVIAFEMAQQLYAKGQTVALLALFDTELWPITIRSKVYHLLRRVQLRWDRLKLLDPQMRLEYVWSTVRKIRSDLYKKLNSKCKRAAGKIYSLLRQSVSKNFIQVEDEIWRAGQSYVPKIYPGKITLFQADQTLGV